MSVVLLNFISDKHKDIKVTLEYSKEELTTNIIINALRNKALEMKASQVIAKMEIICW